MFETLSLYYLNKRNIKITKLKQYLSLLRYNHDVLNSTNIFQQTRSALFFSS